MTRNPPGFAIMSRPCDQCLLSPDRIVSARRAAQIIRETVRDDCHFICHKGTLADREIACRAHYDKTGGGQTARIFRRLGMIVEVDPDTVVER